MVYMTEQKETGVKILGSGKKALDDIWDITHIARVEIVTRTMEWLAAQDRSLQAIILGQIDPVDEPALLAMIQGRKEVCPDHVSAFFNEIGRVLGQDRKSNLTLSDEAQAGLKEIRDFLAADKMKQSAHA